MNQSKRFLKIFYLLLIVSLLLSCALPSFPFAATATAVPTAQPTPTARQEPLPPVLTEVSPADGSQIGLNDPITFYFSDSMDRTSVEGALSGLPTGSLSWTDESTLTFIPEPSLPPKSDITVAIETSARAANGLSLQSPIELSYTTADLLRPINVLPTADSQDITPTNAVAVTFNQPVVPLGSEPSADLPAAFTLDPAAKGSGEWLNTSTYVFYPDPALDGGISYTATLSTNLTAVSGSALDTTGSSLAWSFKTSLPKLLTVDPPAEAPLPLDASFVLTFNQPMDTASVESAFSMLGSNIPITGTIEWNDTDTVLTFTPSSMLDRSTNYNLFLTNKALGRGGTSITLEHEYIFRTYPSFALTDSDPAEGGVKAEMGPVTVLFTSPVKNVSNLNDYVSVAPEVSGLDVSLNENTMFINGYFLPETDYTLTISPALADKWEQPLDVPFTLHFSTAPAAPSLAIPSWNNTFFVRPSEASLQANATNIQRVDISVADLPLADFLEIGNSYEALQSYTPQNPVSYSQNYDLAPSRSEPISLPIALTRGDLTPGLYFMRVSSPQVIARETATAQVNQYIVVSSNVNLALKFGATEALVWATDLRTDTPVTGATVSIFDATGLLITSGQTDQQGLWQGSLPPQIDPYGNYIAMLSEPGQDDFAMTLTAWNSGVTGGEFGLPNYITPPQPQIYIYTDRPIYRPGQTVYFRGIARQAFNGRYDLPDFSSVSLALSSDGRDLQAFNLPLSPYGTFHGEYQIPEGAAPGYYGLSNPDLNVYFSFQVAEYRKPEIELNVAFSKDQVEAGGQLQVKSDAKYYFGAPAGGLEVNWNLFTQNETFNLPGYQTGVLDLSWMQPAWARGSNFGSYLGNGTAHTAADGTLNLDLPAIPQSDSLQRLTLELTTQDESGLPLSARADVLVNPAEFYIGVKPDQWVGQSGTAIGFDVFTVDWEKQASPSQALQAEFKKVTWDRKDPPPEAVYETPTYEATYDLVGSSNLVTGADGKARLSFTPQQPGTYMLEVFGSGARTQALLWVGGGENAAWPNLLNQQIHLVADRDNYLPDQTASIFIPNDFGERLPALVTVERGTVLKAEVITLGASGTTYSLPLTDEYAPNVYVATTVLGPDNQFRQGYVNLKVQPINEELQVELTAAPEINQPRGEMTLSLRVTDSAGNPVQGEFSLSVVDKAVLALADPNSQDILSAFYGSQPLGISTGLSLAAYSGRFVLQPPGRGGGGGGAGTLFVRDQFPDTAYWNPNFLTDEQGMGQVKVTLPDNLTTWDIETRGLTIDTRVGQAETEVVTTKPLLIRPVTPRFLVIGDHVELGAVVHNNTNSSLQVTVDLQGNGFKLDDPADSTQTINVPANNRQSVSWWGTAENADQADLVFSVKSNGSGQALQDAARPALGPLPIRDYVAPQTFVTAGLMTEGGSRREVVSLPRSFSPSGGSLDVELSPSLGASLLTSLKAMPAPAYTRNNEVVLSYFLPNLEMQRALQASGISDPDLQARLDASVDTSISALLRNQNDDGGWGWTDESPSDIYISAYILFGLGRARQAGISVPDQTFEQAHTYLRGNALTGVFEPGWQPWQYDRLTFAMYALLQSGGIKPEDADILGILHGQVNQMSPWAQALLGLITQTVAPSDQRGRDLITNLEASAIRTASSSHWESTAGDLRNPGSPLFTTAVVTYALAQRDPASPVLIESVRYLSAHRDVHSLWGSTYETAWVILALTEAMKGFGELQADFSFNATLNGAPLASGDVSGTEIFNPVIASVPLEYLSPTSPNALTINRENGLGRLYYRAALLLHLPVDEVQPLDHGMQVERAYFAADCQKDCPQLSTFKLAPGKQITAHLTLTLPNDAYYLILEDFIPAGTEILNQNLNTSQQAQNATDVIPADNGDSPFSRGWGWWLFGSPQIGDDSILWTADYLPAGTYQLTYTLVPAQAGEFHVLPAHAWQAFFPEVQGTSGGMIFEIKP